MQLEKHLNEQNLLQICQYIKKASRIDTGIDDNVLATNKVFSNAKVTQLLLNLELALKNYSNNIFNKISHLSKEIVTTLDVTTANDYTLYLLKKIDSNNDEYFEQYIFDSSTKTFTMIGTTKNTGMNNVKFYQNDTDYYINDIVLYKSANDYFYSIYVCKVAHNSGTSFISDNWEIVDEKQQLIHVTATQPSETNILWIDITDPNNPVLKFHDGTKWEELGGSGGQIGNVITIIDNTVTNDEVIGALASYNYFAKRDIYGDENIHMGRKEGSVIGRYSGAIGKDCVASEMYSVAMGNEATASGMYSLAKGNGATASGDCSSAEGYCTVASGYYSHAEGANSESKGWYSHAEGNTTLSKAQNSHCEGFKTITEGQSAHAEGEETLAKGDNSHTQGKLTIANGLQSSAEGLGTIASGDNQTVLGKYNLEDKNHTYALIIGSGVDDSSRNNIYTIDWAGNGKYNGDVIATDSFGNEVSLLTLANNSSSGFYTETFVGNNSKSITINHNIGNPNVSAKVYDATTNKEVEFEIELTSGINLTLKSDILLTPDMKFKIIVTL